MRIPDESAHLKDEVPEGMILLACKGPAHCQRNFRALSCRQFPFFPYVSSDYRFIGLAYEWEFEERCWVISNLHRVANPTGWSSSPFMMRCLHSDRIFSTTMPITQSVCGSRFMEERRRIPLLHRNGKDYLVSPKSGRLVRDGFKPISPVWSVSG